MQHLTSKAHEGVGMYRFGYSLIGKPFLSVYCYEVDGLLIDTAQRNCEQKVLKTFEEKQINSILLTHWHEDHSGNAEALASFHEAIIYAPSQCLSQLKNGFKVLPYERLLFGEIRLITQVIQPFPKEIITENYRLTPVFTPGHSEDHTAFIEPDKGWLFAGDLFVGIEIRFFRKGEKFWPQVESFKRILEYDFDVIFCGHHPRLKDGRKWMQRKLQHFEDFGGRVRELHERGFSVKEVMKEMKLKENTLLNLLLSNDIAVAYMVEAACEPE
ncbi:MAG: MBL fold metallo-hydrolase [Spirosomataceae bacterium]|jgi:glyoxylase-like metal-dependent hydrolase (beta-lactamase superfamily II)